MKLTTGKSLTIQRYSKPETSVFTGLSLGKPIELGGWEAVLLAPGEEAEGPVLQAKQVHGGNIVSATALSQMEGLQADGIITGGDLAISIKTADCLPFIVTTDQKACVLHVSRKTLIYGLMDNLASLINPVMIEKIYIGPHICKYHFTFKEEGRELRLLRERFPKAIHYHQGLIYVSLRAAVQKYFDEWQVHPERIIEDGRCTYELKELPSYRRHLDNKETSKLGHLRTMVYKRP